VPEVVLATSTQSVQSAIAEAAAETFNTQPIAEAPVIEEPIVEAPVIEEQVIEEPVTSPEPSEELGDSIVSDEVSPFATNDNEELSEDSYEDEDDFNDLPTNNLVRRQLQSSKPKPEGMFSSLTGMFKRSKGDDDDDLEQEDSISEESSTSMQKSESEGGNAPTGQVQPNSEPVSTTVVPRREPKGYEPPKELDGRTQLVALAPQDGNVYFEELIEKYNDLPVDQLPPAVTVARDMANVDYLALVQAACVKDLDAFSKLLGLHRVMTEADCSAWVHDMDLLRKGYGDAVLATVVSKYSVVECREILGAVYQRPGARKAAG